ncbi:hypothetical protein B0H11DRAFT_2428943 [Mycena galericulata]|nr:hypothetical protein B0H11DRAFT_2428943 [Mycena galericulata]
MATVCGFKCPNPDIIEMFDGKGALRSILRIAYKELHRGGSRGLKELLKWTRSEEVKGSRAQKKGYSGVEWFRKSQPAPREVGPGQARHTLEFCAFLRAVELKDDLEMSEQHSEHYREKPMATRSVLVEPVLFHGVLFNERGLSVQSAPTYYWVFNKHDLVDCWLWHRNISLGSGNLFRLDTWSCPDLSGVQTDMAIDRKFAIQARPPL